MQHTIKALYNLIERIEKGVVTPDVIVVYHGIESYGVGVSTPEGMPYDKFISRMNNAIEQRTELQTVLQPTKA